MGLLSRRSMDFWTGIFLTSTFLTGAAQANSQSSGEAPQIEKAVANSSLKVGQQVLRVNGWKVCTSLSFTLARTNSPTSGQIEVLVSEAEKTSTVRAPFGDLVGIEIQGQNAYSSLESAAMESAAQAAEGKGQPCEAGRILYELAAKVGSKDAAKGLVIIDRALQDFTKGGAELEPIAALLRKASLYRRARKSAEAIAVCADGEARSQKLGLKASFADFKMLHAEALPSRKVEEAIPLMQEAVTNLQSLAPESLPLAAATFRFGDFLAHRGRNADAIVQLGRAVDIYAKVAPNSPEYANTLLQMGQVQGFHAMLDASNKTVARAIPLFAALGDIHGEIDGYGILAANAEKRMETEKALAQLKKIEDLAAGKKEFLYDISSVYHTIGFEAFDRGDLALSERLQRRSLEVLKQGPPEASMESSILYELGIIRLKQGDTQQAENYLQQSIAERLKIGDQGIALVYAYQALDQTYLQAGRVDEAVVYSKKQLELMKQLAPGSFRIAESLDDYGQALTHAGKLDEALATYDEADQLWEKIAPGAQQQAHTWFGKSVIYTSQGKLDQAEEFLAKATRRLEHVSPLDVDTASCAANFGKLALKRNQPAIALERFAEAKRIVETQRAVITDPKSQELLDSEFQELYPDIAEALFAANHPAELAVFSQQTKSRVLLEELASRGKALPLSPTATKEKERLDGLLSAELHALQTQQLTDVEVQAKETRVQQLEAQERELLRLSVGSKSLASTQEVEKLADVQSLLDPGTLVLDYVVGPSSTFLTAIASNADLPAEGGNPAGVRIFKIDATAKSLGAQISKLRLALVSQSPTDADGKALYDLLMGPVASLVNSERFHRIIISPHGPLHSLPFSCLCPGQGKYLADLKPISYVGSVSLLATIRSQKHANGSLSMLALGDPSYDGADSIRGRASRAATRGMRLGRLVHTRAEAMTIAKLFGGRTLLGKAATPEAVYKLAPQAQRIHLACHGLLDPVEPLASAIALSATPGSDGLIEGWDVLQKLHLNADLVVLSACQTGLGKNEGNEGLDGLARAFMVAGARSVVVSLWDVDDASTGEFMAAFYSALKRGMAKDAALRSAELEIRKLHPNPYYWAPFVLSGDTR